MWHNSAIILRPIERISKSLQHIRKRKHSLSRYQAEPHNGAFLFWHNWAFSECQLHSNSYQFNLKWSVVNLLLYSPSVCLFLLCLFLSFLPLAAIMQNKATALTHAGITFSPCLPNMLPRVIPPAWPWLNKFVSRQPQPPCLTLSCPSNKAGMCLIKHWQWCERVREGEVEMVCGGSH